MIEKGRFLANVSKLQICSTDKTQISFMEKQ